MSCAVISKSKTSAFSKMRLRLADLGITANPCCSAQRMRICAVDLVSDRRDSLSTRANRDRGADGCRSACEYYLATATSFGSLQRVPLVNEMHALTPRP